MATAKTSPVFTQVYKIVVKVPKGRVITYGAVSKLMNGRLTPVGVGWALSALPEKPEGKKKAKDKDDEFHSGNVPWHRVINSKGAISTSKNPNMPPNQQRMMLESEGIVFSKDGTIKLDKYIWTA